MPLAQRIVVLSLALLTLTGCAAGSASYGGPQRAVDIEPVTPGQPLEYVFPNELEFGARFGSGTVRPTSLPRAIENDAEQIRSGIEYGALGFLDETSAGADCGGASTAVRNLGAEPLENAYVELQGPAFEGADAGAVVIYRFEDPMLASKLVSAARLTLDACVSQADLYPALKNLRVVPTTSASAVAWTDGESTTPTVNIVAFHEDILILGGTSGPAMVIEQVVQLVADTLTARSAGEDPLGTESDEWCAVLADVEPDIRTLESAVYGDGGPESTGARASIGAAVPRFLDAAYDDGSTSTAESIADVYEQLQEAGGDTAAAQDLRETFDSTSYNLLYSCPTRMFPAP